MVTIPKSEPKWFILLYVKFHEDHSPNVESMAIIGVDRGGVKISRPDI